MAKYKKRKDGRYQANVIVGKDEETGKRIYAPTIYAHSIPKLEEKKAEVKDQVNKGIYADDKNMTVSEWADTWFETDKDTAGIRTKEMYETCVYSHIVPDLGFIRLRDLKKSDIQKMINDNKEHRRTCEQLRMTVKQMLFAAIDEGLLYKHVALNIKLPAKIKNEKRPLNDIEKAAIKKADLTDKERAFLYILTYCGTRRGEILALSRNDINFSSETIHIHNAVTFDHGSPVLKPIPKTDNGLRTLPMPKELKVVLEPYVKGLKGLYLFEMERKEGLMSKSSYDKFWGHIIEKINAAAGGTTDIKAIHGLTAHVFRRNYGTSLYYAGVPAKEAQFLLGHSDIKLTLELYTFLDKEKGTAKNKLDNFALL